ncbi:7-cyano-7-deazaguanine synthase [Pyruvatibacter mobilis]|uniref:7-cyano-7-deazaguanine synthase n=1 Tax=Pyruvatibacter mobilis TaxID=1712261 RepID=UPI003BA9B345
MRALLFSGGVESTCLAVMTKPDLAVTIDYGQVCAPGEIRAAKHIASLIGMPHRVIEVSLGHLGAGEMTGVPSEDAAGRVPEHWPLRNQMLLTVAAMALADCDLRELVIGTVLTDRVHNDGTPEFLAAMERLLQTQLSDFKLSAPASTITTDDLVHSSGVSRDILGWTFSCHRAEVACGACRGCNKSLDLFARLKREDSAAFAVKTSTESDAPSGTVPRRRSLSS